MINDRNFTLQDLALVHRVMNLPEPFLWVQRDHGVVVGLIEGWIHQPDDRIGGYCEVDHMVLLPLAQKKLTTMMTMSRNATSALHARGLDVVIKISREDYTTRPGLRAWAKRCRYVKFHDDSTFHWYVNRKDNSPDGQGKSSDSEGGSRCTRQP